jgi:hypothetical protein
MDPRDNIAEVADDMAAGAAPAINIAIAPAAPVENAASADADDIYMQKFDLLEKDVGHLRDLANEVTRPINSNIGDHRLDAATQYIAQSQQMIENLYDLLVEMNNVFAK